MTDDKIELKPCPFCGASAYMVEDVYFPHIRCSNNLCAVKISSYKTIAAAQSRWNTRQQHEADHEQVLQTCNDGGICGVGGFCNDCHLLKKPQAASVALTNDQIARHKIRAGDCPPGSLVMLVSSIERLQEYRGGQEAVSGEPCVSDSQQSETQADLSITDDTQGVSSEPVAYQHTMYDEADNGINVRYSDDPEHDYGIAGRSFDAAFTVITKPLYSADQLKAEHERGRQQAFAEVLSAIEELESTNNLFRKITKRGFLVLLKQGVKEKAGQS